MSNMKQNSSLDEALILGIKKKGIGPKGSKKVDPTIISNAISAMLKLESNLIRSVTFWVGCLLLEPFSNEEKNLLIPFIKDPRAYFRDELVSLSIPGIFQGPKEEFLTLIRKIIKKENLNAEALNRAMKYFWDTNQPNWMRAAFLQALRLKRESFAENYYCFKSMYHQCHSVQVDLPVLIDLCDAYDGSTRSYHLTPYIAATIAAFGYPCVIHGTKNLGPKYGVTSRGLMSLSQLSTNISLEEARNQLSAPEIGWVYVDQKEYFPEMYAFQSLRNDMLKRPFPATFEKYVQPIRNRSGNHLFGGYVHFAYRDMLVKLFTLTNQVRSFIHIRSIEGSIHTRLNKPSPYLGFHYPDKHILDTVSEDPKELFEDMELENLFQKRDANLLQGELDPRNFGLNREQQPLIRGITLEETHTASLKALAGEKGLILDLIIYHSAWIVSLVNPLLDRFKLIKDLQEIVFSGKARKHFYAHASKG